MSDESRAEERAPGFIPDKVLVKYKDFCDLIVQRDHWKPYYESTVLLRDAWDKFGVGSMNFSVNAAEWAFDLDALVREIAMNIAWMNAYANFYKENVDPEVPRFSYYEITFHADSAITRIFSARDKLAALVLAFYLPFDPEEDANLPSFANVTSLLQNPNQLVWSAKKFPVLRNFVEKNGRVPWQIHGQETFTSALSLLSTFEKDNQKKRERDSFDNISKYRHSKIHRREPRILLGGVQSFHGGTYIVPVLDQSKWQARLRDRYPTWDNGGLKIIEESCTTDGVLYDRPQHQRHLWSFDQIRDDVTNCFEALLQSAKICFDELTHKPPLDGSEQSE